MRIPKPWPYRDSWVSKLDGKRIVLCPITESKKTAEKILREMLVKRDQQPKTVAAHAMTFGELLAKFLDFCQANRHPKTYENHRDCLKSFAEKHQHTLARSLKYLDGEEHKQAILNAGRCPNHFVVSLNTCLNWAVDEAELLAVNPFRKLKQVARDQRERTVKDDEFQAMLRHAGTVQLRQVLTALRWSVTRPQDIRQLRCKRKEESPKRMSAPLILCEGLIVGLPDCLRPCYGHC